MMGEARAARAGDERGAWPRFRFDQRNLQRLCRIWSVHESEYLTENMLFGFDRIIRAYAELPDGEPLPWAMEHAITFDDPKPLIRDVETRLPVILAVTKGQADVLRQHNAAGIYSIGSSFFYMQSIYDRHFPGESALERRGTLVFPDKSVIHKDVDYDREKFAEELAAMPAEFQPVVVSIFWKDYLRGTHRPFEKAGLTLVTSGYSYDPAFLFRQYDLCRQFKYAIANDLSTSFCLSVLSGCHFMYRPTGSLRVRHGSKTETFLAEPSLSLPAKQMCIAASPYPPHPDGSQQRALAERYAGFEHVRPPKFFRTLFEDARKQLQSRPLRSAGFGPQTRLDDVAGWLPRGVDPGGWSLGDLGVTIPAALSASSVRLHLHIPRRSASERMSTVSVMVGSEVLEEFAIAPGFWTLDIPARPGIDQTVLIRWPLRERRPPAYRGIRLFQISAGRERPAGLSWKRRGFFSWCGEIEGRTICSILKQMAVSRGGDLLRACRGQDLPQSRDLPF